jgi:HSP20 family protein
MSLVKRRLMIEPWTEIGEIRNRIRNLFEEPFTLPMFPEPVGYTPSIDVWEKDGKLMVAAELPGMTRDDVEIDLADNVLTLRGEKKTETEKNEGEMHFVERTWGSFHRSFTLPFAVDEGAITAEFKNGLLTITLPRMAQEPVKGRKIEITTPTT